MPAELAWSARAVPYSRIRELAEEAMRMEGVLRLYFGEPDLPTPAWIRQAALEAMEAGYTFYTENAGLLSTRQAIARYYDRLHRVQLDPAREIVVTASGVQALHLAIRCVLDPGDEAILLTPAWPNAAAIVRLCNAVPREVPLRLQGEECTIDIDAIRQALGPRSRLLVYTSPSNPVGWVATEADQRRLLEFARDHGLWLLADEVYERIYYAGPYPGAPAPSLLRIAGREDAVIVVQSFSKAYCMTGWRLGWLVAREDLARRAAELNEFVVSHAPSFAQKAGEVALDRGEEHVRAMVERYRRNRDLCWSGLSSIAGIHVPKADGAFYLFPHLEGLEDSFGFCRALLHKERVGLAPGVAFGPGGEGHFRISYAVAPATLEQALERISRFCAAGGARPYPVAGE